MYEDSEVKGELGLRENIQNRDHPLLSNLVEVQRMQVIPQVTCKNDPFQTKKAILQEEN